MGHEAEEKLTVGLSRRLHGFESSLPFTPFRSETYGSRSDERIFH